MYPTGQSTNIGTLLRMIREDQNQGIAATPPAAQPGSPIRDVVQGPITSPEDPGSSRVVSIRPEGVTQTGTPGTVQPAAPAPSVAPSVVAPVAPVTPVPTPSAPSSAPSQPSRSSSPSLPSIGTSIKASPAVLGTSTSAYKPAVANFVPQRTRIGVPISGGINIPTPTPAPQNKTKTPSASQRINASFYRA